MADTFETVLFNYETTYRTDFRYGQIKPSVKTTFWTWFSTSRKIKPSTLKNVHTMTECNSVLPFNLFVKFKDIVRTNPREVQQVYAKPADTDREKVQKTRPRLLLTPAVRIDDVPSKEARQLLVSDIYMTTSQKAMSDGISLTTNTIRAPFLGTFAPANPITLPKLRPPYVAPEWRMDSVSWDRRQLRAQCDPSKEFYLARQHKCAVCQVPAYSQQGK